jgi:cytochrome P450
MVVVTDYASIENLLVKQQHSLERSELTGNLFRGILPTAQISLPTNDMWKHHRRIIGTSMTSKYLSLTTPRANESIKTLIGYWRLKSSKAGERAFQSDQDMENATMDAICGMAFGSNWGILDSFKTQITKYDPATGSIEEALFPVEKPEMLQSVMYLFDNIPRNSVFPKITDFFTSKSPTWKRHNRQLHTYLDNKLSIAREKAKLQGAEVSIDLADNTLDLMVARELRGEDWMPDIEMKDEIYQYLLAGTETSGTTLTWFVKYMTNHPEVQLKLRKHLNDVLPELQDRQPRFEDLNATKTPYLEAVVHEALRLSRTASGYGRDGESLNIVES